MGKMRKFDSTGFISRFWKATLDFSDYSIDFSLTQHTIPTYVFAF